MKGARRGGGLGGGHGGGTTACGGGGGRGGGWSPCPIFLEQPLEREFTPFFLQMTARVCGGGGGVPSPLIEPLVGRERKGPTWGPQPTPNIIIENRKRSTKRRA